MNNSSNFSKIPKKWNNEKANFNYNFMQMQMKNQWNFSQYFSTNFPEYFICLPLYLLFYFIDKKFSIRNFLLFHIYFVFQVFLRLFPLIWWTLVKNPLENWMKMWISKNKFYSFFWGFFRTKNFFFAMLE